MLISDFMLSKDDFAFVVVDLQERLAAVMEERERVVRNTGYLIELAGMFGIPVVVTEQYPKGLGHTVTELAGPLESVSAIEKLTFDCCGEGAFIAALGGTGRRKVVVAGMETHVCVLQTVLSLLKAGYIAHVAHDAVCSRDSSNKRTALEMMSKAGAIITTTETVLFQALGRAGTEEFKKMSRMIK